MNNLNNDIENMVNMHIKNAFDEGNNKFSDMNSNENNGNYSNNNVDINIQDNKIITKYINHHTNNNKKVNITKKEGNYRFTKININQYNKYNTINTIIQ